MAEVISISVEGEAQVKSALAKVEKDIVDRLPLNKDLSDELSRQASARAPRLTGELASTVKGNPSADKAQILAGGGGVVYAGVQEYGWPEKNIKEQPYLRPAVYENLGYIEEKYNDYIKSIIKRYDLD
jgi:hypothetical protein